LYIDIFAYSSFSTLYFLPTVQACYVENVESAAYKTRQ